MKLQEIAHKLGCHLEGNPSTDIKGVAGIDHAGAGQLTFLANRRYLPLLKTTRASAVLVEDGVKLEREDGLEPLAALRTANPYLAFAQALELFYAAPVYAPGVHATAIVAASAKIGEGAHIGPYCFVDEGAEIGARAVLHSFVTIYRWRENWSRLFCARACRGAGRLHLGRSGDPAERRGDRRGWIGLCEARGWHVAQTCAIGTGGAGR